MALIKVGTNIGRIFLRETITEEVENEILDVLEESPISHRHRGGSTMRALAIRGNYLSFLKVRSVGVQSE